ncbi:hypothetical protein [Paenibacillus alkalitolerans]|uniref:hypothetical protein n=1 Tax=Paenibacillus alkalitolerans TaxID=2799335 RepID=UPI0018F514C3|nr:hypothetical protein [Paenibacillus alkalitolerans]
MLTRIDLLKDWNVTGRHSERGYDLQDSVKLEYPAPANAVGWYPIGFERGNDSALEAMDWHALKLRIRTRAEQTEISVKANFADNRSVAARPDLRARRIAGI